MTRQGARSAAVQVGEFAFGAAGAYLAVGAVWAAESAAWSLLLVAAALVAAAVAAELRFGARMTGLLAGVVPASIVGTGLCLALSRVVAHLH